MNALIVRTDSDGDVDLDLHTDPTDLKAKMFVTWLYKAVAEWEQSLVAAQEMECTKAF